MSGIVAPHGPFEPELGRHMLGSIGISTVRIGDPPFAWEPLGIEAAGTTGRFVEA